MRITSIFPALCLLRHLRSLESYIGLYTEVANPTFTFRQFYLDPQNVFGSIPRFQFKCQICTQPCVKNFFITITTFYNSQVLFCFIFLNSPGVRSPLQSGLIPPLFVLCSQASTIQRILDLLIMNSIRIIMFIFYFLNYVSFKHYSLSEVQKLIQQSISVICLVICFFSSSS